MDTALLAGLIVMDVSAGKVRNFGALMGEVGDLDVLGVKYPRMQMLTVAQISGRRAVQHAERRRAEHGCAAAVGDVNVRKRKW